MAKCMCVISGDGGIAGELAFTQASEDAPTLIVGEIRGLSEVRALALTQHVSARRNRGKQSGAGLIDVMRCTGLARHCGARVWRPDERG